jgi:pyruvate dehydrogenase kinase 2/3/4
VVGCHEPIQEIHEIYMRDLRRLQEIRPISEFGRSESDVDDLIKICREIMDDNTEVLPLLIRGMEETHGFSGRPDEEESGYIYIEIFMKNLLDGRLSIKLMLEHLIKLEDQFNDPSLDTHKRGILTKHFSPVQLVENVYKEQVKIVEDVYNTPPPKIKVKQVLAFNQGRKYEHDMNGEPEATFPYIVEPIEYSLREIIKNALRAQAKAQIKEGQIYTLDNSTSNFNETPILNPIEALIVSHNTGFSIKIADHGTGIISQDTDNIWKFNFSKPDEDDEEEMAGGRLNAYSEFQGLGSVAGDNKSLFGYGCGLPISKLYCEKLGGKVNLKSIPNYGTSLYFDFPYLVDSGFGETDERQHFL